MNEIFFLHPRPWSVALNFHGVSGVILDANGKQILGIVLKSPDDTCIEEGLLNLIVKKVNE